MTWTFTTDVAAFAAAAEPWLLRDPVRNTVPLTVLRGDQKLDISVTLDKRP